MTLAESLQELQRSSGLQMAAIVSADGLVIDASATDEVDVESVCSVASNGLLMMEALGQELSEGIARITTLEYDRHTVVMAPLDEDNLLVLVAGQGINLGRIRIVLRRKLTEFSQQMASV